jgi:hypothetical protein
LDTHCSACSAISARASGCLLRFPPCCCTCRKHATCLSQVHTAAQAGGVQGQAAASRGALFASSAGVDASELLQATARRWRLPCTASGTVTGTESCIAKLPFIAVARSFCVGPHAICWCVSAGTTHNHGTTAEIEAVEARERYAALQAH